MTHWRWQGRDREGAWCDGEADAESREALRQTLLAQGVALRQLRRSRVGWGRIKLRDLNWLIRQLATLLGAGVPLTHALQGLAREACPMLGPLLEDVGRQLEAGLPLSQALARHPHWFDAGFCQGVAAGEQSGQLDLTLERLATEREKRQRLHARVRAALMYPLAILLMALAVLVVMVVAVIPAFKQAFAEAGHPLPGVTRWVIAAADALMAHAVGLLLSILLAAWLSRIAWQRYVAWQRAWDSCCLGLPFFGLIVRQAVLARWARTLGLLFAAGVPLVDALGSAGLAAGNHVYLQASLQIQRQIQQGSSLTSALKQSRCFPGLIQQLAAVGEASGALDQMFERVALYYEEQVDHALLVLTSVLEPLAMALLGALCGALIWALYLPVFQLGQVVG